MYQIINFSNYRIFKKTEELRESQCNETALQSRIIELETMLAIEKEKEKEKEKTGVIIQVS